MASKKYTLLLGALCFFLTNLSAQSYDWKDSSLIPKKSQAQHNEFLQNQQPFPAKPRNQWEIGLSVGNVLIAGDVTPVFPQIGWGAHVRKAFGYIFSARLQYAGGIAKGLNWTPAFNFAKNSAWDYKPGVSPGYNAPTNYRYTGPAGGVPGLPGGSPGELYQLGSRDFKQGLYVPYNEDNQDVVYYNNRTVSHQLSLQGIITLNNIRFHKSKTSFIVYGLGGVGGMIYETTVDALDANGNTYAGLFNTVYNSYQVSNKNKRDIRRDLKAGMDKKYETAAEGQDLRRPKLFDMTFRPMAQIGAGVAFKVGKRFSIGIEEVLTIAKDDLLDGQRWQEHAMGDAVLTRDFDSWHYTNLNFNYSLGSKSVEPLWWLNPLDYAYNELNAPRHMKLPKPVLDDADGDGVTDQFDNEPNTPAGCPVDTHGVSRDTDGDGVPDCKDKELITPTQCQPVDADGVGKCPDPECCKNIGPAVPACNLVDLPSINFGGNSSVLSAEAKALVGSVATSLRGNPECKLTVCGSAAKSKSGQALGQKRVDAIVKYLVEVQGISADRVVAQYDCHEGDPSVVELRAEQK